MSKNSSKKGLILSIIIILIIIISFIIGYLILNNIEKNKTKEVSNNEQIKSYQEKDVLNIEKNNTISNYFPDDITEITLVNYLSDSSNPTTYVINDIEKMKEFTDLFTTVTWSEYDAKYSNNLQPTWKVTIKGSTITTFNMIRSRWI